MAYHARNEDINDSWWGHDHDFALAQLRFIQAIQGAHGSEHDGLRLGQVGLNVRLIPRYLVLDAGHVVSLQLGVFLFTFDSLSFRLQLETTR